MIEKEITMLDLHEPSKVEIFVDVSTGVNRPYYNVWVNVNGICRLRACRVEKQNIVIEDKRRQ